MWGLAAYFVVATVTVYALNRWLTRIEPRVAAVLVLLPLVFTLRAFVTNSIYAPIDLAYQTEPLTTFAERYGIDEMHNPTLSDTYAQMLPWRSVVREAFRRHEWPLINPYSLCGDLLAGAAQPAPYDPLNLIAVPFDFVDGVNLTATLAYLWAALGAWLLARHFGVRSLSALFAAIAWMWSSFIAFFIEVPLGRTFALLPALCLATIRMVKRPSAGTIAMTTGILVVLILAGHPESMLQAGTIAALFGVAALPGVKSKAAAVASGLIACTTAVLLCAFFLLPIVDAIRQSAEYQYRVMYGPDATQSLSWLKSAQKLTTTFIPFVYGTPWREIGRVPGDLPTPHTAYCGSVMLAFAAAGLLFSKRRDLLPLLGIALLGLLLGISLPPVAKVIMKVPLFALARNERFIAATALVISILAAVGADLVFEKRSKAGFTLLLLGALGVAGVIALVPYMRRIGLSVDFIKTSAAPFVFPLLLAGAVCLMRWRNSTVLALVLLLAVVQRTAEIGQMVPTVTRSAFYEQPSVLKLLHSRGDRFVSEGYTFLPNISAHYHLYDVRGFQSITLQRLMETCPLWCVSQHNWFNRVDDLSKPFLSFLNVRYALHDPAQRLPASWRALERAGSMLLVENTRVIPRAFVPRTLRMNVSYPAIIEEMRRETDFEHTAWINRVQPGPWNVSTESNGVGEVAILADGLSRYWLDAKMTSDAWVVISQAGWRGWRAFEGTSELPVHDANHAFLALHLTRGSHRILLKYAPISFAAGLGVSGATLLAVIVIGFWAAARQPLYNRH